MNNSKFHRIAQLPPKYIYHTIEETSMFKDKMKYCPICGQVWELVGTSGRNFQHIEYYPIVPSYGKPRVICDGCESGD